MAEVSIEMGWWPFKRKEKVLEEEPHMRGTRMWIQDLREICERCYDNHEEGQRQVGVMQAEWNEARDREEVASSLLDGLERRAYKLLQADAETWLEWLDNEEFWNPGWREEPLEE